MANEFDSYDRDMYELAEAEAKLDLALKQIESKYYIKHIIMESSGEFTPEEIIAMEAEDAENEANDKRGAIRRFIDTIIKKIQEFINGFKKNKETYDTIRPDDEINMPVSEEDIRKYTKTVNIVSDKLEAAIKAAEGSDKAAYDKAIEEYDNAVKELDQMEDISDAVINAENREKDSKSFKRFVVKGIVITAAIEAIKKVDNVLESVLGSLSESAASAAGTISGKLFAHFDKEKADVDQMSKNLASKLGNISGKIGKMRKSIDKALKEKDNIHRKKKLIKDAEATSDTADELDDDIVGETDISKFMGRRHNGDYTVISFIKRVANDNLDKLTTDKNPRPKYSDEGKIYGHLVDMGKKGIFEKISDAFKASHRADKAKDKVGMKGIGTHLVDRGMAKKLFEDRFNGGKGKPVFFDLWGIFYHGGFGGLDNYVANMEILLDVYNDVRKNDLKKNPIKWDKNIAMAALKDIFTTDKGWNSYQEDETKSKSTAATSVSKNNPDANSFLIDNYRTMSKNDLSNKLNDIIKNGKASTITSSSIFSFGTFGNVISDFSLSDGDINYLDSLKNDMRNKFGNDFNVIERALNKASIKGNWFRMKYSTYNQLKKDLKYEFKNDNRVNDVINVLQDHGWKEKYLMNG